MFEGDRKTPGDIKIIDFGSATSFDEEEDLKTKLGTPYYIAPEVLKKKYDSKCDLWSVGVITYIALSGLPPFNGATDAQILKKVEKSKQSYDAQIWKTVSDQAKDFINQLLTKEPEMRPNAQQALEHPWLLNDVETEE